MNHQRSEGSGALEVIGQRYALVRQLREEPWGEVWLAQDQLLETEVGLKILPREAPEWDAARQALAREAIQALKLRHPQVLGVYYLGLTEKFLYLVQEPFAGETLLSQLIRHRRFGLPQTLDLLEQLCPPLDLAHRLGMIHRSLSPLNILLDSNEVRLANFAFPPVDGDQAIYLELRAYNPPEAIQGEPLTPAGNVFSLGVLGFRLAAGSLPYPLTFDEPFPYRLETPPVDLEEIPLPLQNFLLQCLAVDPEERLADAGAFLAQLQQAREQMRPARREGSTHWGEEKARPVRQVAAQAGVLLGKLNEASKPLREKLGEKLGETARTSMQTLKKAPRRLWWGAAVALLIVAVALGGLRSGRRAAAPPPPPTPAAAPVKLPAMGGGPPLVEGPAPAPTAAVKPTAVPPTPPPMPAAPGPAAPPEAKAAAQERYLLVVATFASQKQAEALQKKLKAKNYRARVIRSTGGGKTLYQVQVGPLAGAKPAAEAAAKIKTEEKLTPKVVKMTGKAPKKNSNQPARRPAT
jgi:cell division septation protein DedD